MKTPQEAKAVGLIVDNHCYPNIAYSGDRFNPVHIEQILSEREADLTISLTQAKADIDRLNEARRIDCLTTSHYVANVALNQLWEMLGVQNQTEAVLKLKEMLK